MIVGSVTGSLAHPRTMLLGRYDDEGHLTPRRMPGRRLAFGGRAALCNAGHVRCFCGQFRRCPICGGRTGRGRPSRRCRCSPARPWNLTETNSHDVVLGPGRTCSGCNGHRAGGGRHGAGVLEPAATRYQDDGARRLSTPARPRRGPLPDTRVVRVRVSVAAHAHTSVTPVVHVGGGASGADAYSLSAKQGHPPAAVATDGATPASRSPGRSRRGTPESDRRRSWTISVGFRPPRTKSCGLRTVLLADARQTL
ncbi:hypothetical protein OQI_23795 [Streptomyces pharetrae CZA14]|uniref:Uncharacterized protein n=1 Tax=Streptomyces pharetrae CZA14 TaxID=1144883 RepID=A0ABX3YDV6_9ACTN|nr:hypothetical protein OQI_23795 [Streptomyces pharetrae CZA14]